VVRRLFKAYNDGVYDGAPLGFDGTEDGGRCLSQRDRNTLESCLTFRERTEVHMRGVIFRSRQHRALKTCNTGIMYPWIRANGSTTTSYGELITIYEICSPVLSPPGRAQMPPLVKVSWLTTQRGQLFDRIPIVRRDPDSDWNRDQQYAFLHKVLCWNVAFWPKDLRAKRRADEDLLAIFRYSKDKPTDR
jgi:hypothetical protein